MQIVHCDLALRNIMVSRFPWEVKVAEFGLARDLTRMRSRRSTHKKQRKVSHINHMQNFLNMSYEIWDSGDVVNMFTKFRRMHAYMFRMF